MTFFASYDFHKCHSFAVIEDQKEPLRRRDLDPRRTLKLRSRSGSNPIYKVCPHGRFFLKNLCDDRMLKFWSSVNEASFEKPWE